MRTNGQPSGQLFPKRWPLSNPNRTKSIMNKHNVKHHRNSDTKTGNRQHNAVMSWLPNGYFPIVLFSKWFLAHLSQRLIDELIVYPCSGLRRCRYCRRRRPSFSNVFSSETARPIKAKFYVESLLY